MLPTTLQEVTVKIQKNDACKTSYGNDAPGGILENMLCAASPNKDSCMVGIRFLNVEVTDNYDIY